MKLRMPNGDIVEGPEGASRKDIIRAYVRQKQQESGYDPNYKFDPEARTQERIAEYVEGMGAAERLGAGFQSGLRDVGRNVGNMVGLVDDEEVESKRDLERPLGRTLAGGTGKFAGEMAGLSPLGAVGAVGRAGAATGKALRGGSRLRKALAAPVARRVPQGAASVGQGAAQGAAAGAIMSGPDERIGGAAAGASVGGLLSALPMPIRRTFMNGLAKRDPKAMEYLAQLKALGVKDPNLPLSAQVDDKAISGFIKSLYEDFLPNFPAARGALTRQADEAFGQFREGAARRALPRATTRELREDISSRGFRDATRRALGEADSLSGVQANVTRRSRAELSDALRGQTKGEFTPSSLGKSSERTWERLNREAAKTGGKTKAKPELQDFAEMAGDVLGDNPRGGSGALGRLAVTSPTREGRQDAVTNLLTAAMSVVEAAGLGTPRAMASKKVQNFLMANTAWQKRLSESVRSGNTGRVMETLSAMRRAMSGRAAEDDDGS